MTYNGSFIYFADHLQQNEICIIQVYVINKVDR